MSFTDAEKEAVISGRIDFFAPNGTKLLDFSIATEYQRTGQPHGETWLDWVQRHVDKGQMKIVIWDPDRY